MAGPYLIEMSGNPASVRDGLRRALGQTPLAALSQDDRSTAEIVLAEVLNNIAEHAYADGDGPIRLWLGWAAGRLVCRIEDEGSPMPGGMPPQGRPPCPEELAEGGFGWHLIRSLADDLAYQRAWGINRLYFTLPAERSPG
ncbi:ATP-binding protein [Neotabrizicola sp. sgz301269]|uniref:ATP-binding protein n=1 Tax=Neotabrizicola sp. sgz301269 TaxID=3276282 RepID=UPI00376FE497